MFSSHRTFRICQVAIESPENKGNNAGTIGMSGSRVARHTGEA